MPFRASRIAVLAATIVLTAPLLAQSILPVAAVESAMPKPGAYRLSKLIGVKVYNNANETVGEIKDLILDPQGGVSTVVLGVGGFVGIGERNVGVPLNEIKFVDADARSDNSNKTTSTGATGTGMINVPDRDAPDHATVDMSKDQVKALPPFKFANDAVFTGTPPANPNRADR
jgi:sporulation protein YlmC with PRC-barrel domain